MSNIIKDDLKLCGQINKSHKNTIAVTEESVLVLGEPNITVKVCISLKRLLIVTFNIEVIRIPSFLVRSEACILSVNQTSMSLRKPW